MKKKRGQIHLTKSPSQKGTVFRMNFMLSFSLHQAVEIITAGDLSTQIRVGCTTPSTCGQNKSELQMERRGRKGEGFLCFILENQK